MAPPLKTKTLSLCSLFSLLLFLHVNGCSAREMKAEEEIPKQDEVLQKDQSEISKPYITAYSTDGIKANQAYLTGYLHPHHQNHKKQKSESYITAYTSKRENQPYITASGTVKKGERPYITAYGTDGIKANQAYLTGYLHPLHQNHKKQKSESYITAYGTSKREDQPYITAYGTVKKENRPYITAYDIVRKLDQPCITAYGTVKRTNQPYITTYGTNKRENRPYVTSYGIGKKDSEGENPKESFTANNKVDHTEAFKTGFFALDDLYIGNKLTLQFPIEEFPSFLTKKEADTIPFSTSQLPSVLQLLSISQDSSMAQAMEGTLDQCELQPLTAETKVCVSSLESMTDFVRSIFGSDSQLDIITTTLPESSRGVPLQSMTVLEISPDFYAPKWVACHPLPYPYAVYYCHFIGSGTKIFKVKLGSENGEQVEALGVCHLDTSEWDPDHILFKRLGFKAGEAPVCHFLPVKHLMWIPRTSEATM